MTNYTSHLLANLTHPIYRDKKLKGDHINDFQELLLDRNPDLVPDLLSFMSDNSSLPLAMLHKSTINKIKPSVWWLCVDRCGAINTGLCKIACQLMSMPASSAAIERVFSNFGVIQTKLRNRLGLSKAAILVTCYRFLRGKDEID